MRLRKGSKHRQVEALVADIENTQYNFDLLKADSGYWRSEES